MDPITLTIVAAAAQAHISPELLLSVCWVETRHRNVVTVHDGKDSSLGLCQVKPQTARFMAHKHGLRFYASDLLNVEKNATYAALYLKYQINRYKGNVWAAVDAYNKGSAHKATVKKKVRASFDSYDTYTDTKYIRAVKKALGEKPWKAN
jgi:soluble lytic murein transglycosylase-like protein